MAFVVYRTQLSIFSDAIFPLILLLTYWIWSKEKKQYTINIRGSLPIPSSDQLCSIHFYQGDLSEPSDPSEPTQESYPIKKSASIWTLAACPQNSWIIAILKKKLFLPSRDFLLSWSDTLYINRGPPAPVAPVITSFVLSITWFVQILTGLIINITRFVLKMTEFELFLTVFL